MNDNADWDLVIVGAGAAGLVAGVRAAELGKRVLLLEKNRKPGVKILMSGGTRCNLTQNTDAKGIVRAFGRPGRFLNSALAALPPQSVVELFESIGVPTKVEPTGKIFPVSDRALDVQRALLAKLEQTGAVIHPGVAVIDVRRSNEHGFEIQTDSNTFHASQVLLTTGGMSYPGCGTTGDGYAWAKAFGHTIVYPRPALTPLKSPHDWVRSLAGVTIGDVEANVVHAHEMNGIHELSRTKLSKRAHAQSRGSFLFTHSGMSGPVPMNVSRAITDSRQPGPYFLVCDFAPQFSDDEARQWLQSEVDRDGRRAVGNIFGDRFPRRFAAEALRHLEIDPDQRCAELGRKRQLRLWAMLKRLPIPLSGTLGFAKAEVTAGGVSLDEVDSSTMQSKLVDGLYFAGEILDLDGPIGGFNFQSAFSTGWLAASKM